MQARHPLLNPASVVPIDFYLNPGVRALSPDGRYLVFGSNRNNGGTSDTNVFIAEWGN